MSRIHRADSPQAADAADLAQLRGGKTLDQEVGVPLLAQAYEQRSQPDAELDVLRLQLHRPPAERFEQLGRRATARRVAGNVKQRLTAVGDFPTGFSFA